MKFLSAAQRLRGQIEEAEADGVSREAMILRLTHNDVAQLKRDTSLALEDIRFKDGEMWFLGVAVTPGGVAESALERPE
jgi:hypothetical protein